MSLNDPEAMGRIALLTVVLVVAAAITARTQTSVNVDLSGQPPGWRPTADMRVQVADSADGVTLVVWGSSVLDTNGRATLAYYAQSVREGSPFGRPLRVGADLSQVRRPIQIAPIGKNFLVFHSGVDPSARYSFMQFYDTDADTLGRSTWLTGTELQKTSDSTWRAPWVFHVRPDRWRIFLRTWLGVATFAVGDDGRLVDSLVWCGDFPTGLYSYAGLDDLILEHDASEVTLSPKRRPRVWRISRDGYDPRPVPLLFQTFHLGRDTSVVALRDSTLYYYPSIFDSSRVFRRELSFATWGNVLSLSWPRPGRLSMVSRDSLGRILIYLGTGRPGDSSTSARLTIARLTLDAFDGPIRADTALVLVDSSPGARRHWRIAASREIRCDNRYPVSVDFWDDYDGIRFDVELTADGTVRQVAGLAPECGTPVQAVVRRLADDTTSAVLLMSDPPVRLDAPIARRLPVNVTPGVVAVNGGVVVTWRELDTTDRDLLARWEPARDSIGRRVAYLPPPPVRDMPSPVRNVSSSEVIRDRAIVFGGEVLLDYEQRMAASYQYPVDKGRTIWYDGFKSNYRIALARPGSDGWEPVDTLTSDRGFYSTYVVLDPEIAGFDPDDRTIYIRYWERKYGSWHLPSLRRTVAYPRAGAPFMIEPYDLPPSSLPLGTFVPISRYRYVIIDSVRGYLLEGIRTLGTFEHDLPRTPSLRFTALTGPRFLATWHDAEVLWLRMVDSSGALLARIEIPCPGPECRDSSFTFSITESPVDSSMTIVTAGVRGTRVWRLTSSLSMVFGDSLVSTAGIRTAAAASTYTNDTLVVVWQDFRHGEPRIYGTTLRLPSLNPIDTTAGVDTDALGNDSGPRVIVSPNPALDRIDIVAELRRPGETTFELFDVLGRRLITTSTAPTSESVARATFDLSGLATGVYLVKVTTGAATASVCVARK